jgi:hypothetical protein
MLSTTRVLTLALPLLVGVSACDEAAKKGAENGDQVIVAWRSANLGTIELAEGKDSEVFAGGSCRTGKIAALHVDLCEFKDALAADTAKEQGLAKIGANTGAALVRDRFLLVIADRDKADVHGKVLNQVAKIFLEPPPAMGL